MYKSLSKYEKLSFIQSDRVNSPTERREIAKYLNALRIGNEKYVKKFESFGKTPRHMAYNKLVFERFELKKLIMDQFGWISIPKIQIQLNLFDIQLPN